MAVPLSSYPQHTHSLGADAWTLSDNSVFGRISPFNRVIDANMFIIPFSGARCQQYLKDFSTSRSARFTVFEIVGAANHFKKIEEGLEQEP